MTTETQEETMTDTKGAQPEQLVEKLRELSTATTGSKSHVEAVADLRQYGQEAATALSECRERLLRADEKKYDTIEALGDLSAKLREYEEAHRVLSRVRPWLALFTGPRESWPLDIDDVLRDIDRALATPTQEEQ